MKRKTGYFSPIVKLLRPTFVVRYYLFPVVFLFLCVGVLFARSNAVVDSRILPKWYAFAFGSAALLTTAAVIGLKRKEREPFGNNLDPLFSIPVAACFVQALYGLSQYAGLLPALGTFRITGSFDNPAGFAAALCVGFPFTAPLLRNRHRIVRYLAAIAAMTLILGVILCGSRAGLLSIGTVGMVHGLARIRKPLVRRTMWVVLPLLLVGLYFLKRESADGRLLVWRCTAEMIARRPLFGHGPGGFAAGYMNTQADYLREHPDSPYAQLADSVQHPFNEYLSVAVHYGLFGLMALAALGWGVVRRYRRTAHGREPAVRAAGSCLLSIGVFALFSYPLFYPFTWTMALFSLWILFGKPLPRGWAVRGTAVGLAVGLCVWVVKDWRLQRAWCRTEELAARGNPSASLSRYRELYPKFVRNRYFLYNFAYVLNEAGEYAEGLAMAEACRGLWADYYVELLRGEAALGLERYDEAERAFDQAAAMCPNRFMPLYKLVGIYTATGREAEARNLAERILTKEVKIPSATVTAIRYEMRRLIDTQ